MKKSSPNIRQRKFIDNLFLGMSQKAAYIEAGYKAEGHSAESSASKMLRNVEVEAEMKKRLTDVDSRNRIRLARISETALANLLNIIQDGGTKDRTKLKAIKDVLDRVGLRAKEELKREGGMELEPWRVIIKTAVPRPDNGKDKDKED